MTFNVAQRSGNDESIHVLPLKAAPKSLSWLRGSSDIKRRAIQMASNIIDPRVRRRFFRRRATADKTRRVAESIATGR
jgi:hypothetical protein